jgi:predicted nucleic acid-binding protein
MAVARYLVDKSAYGRMHLPEVYDMLQPLISRGLVATCGTTTLELLYSAQSPEDHARISRSIDAAVEWLLTEDVDFRRACQVSAQLARTGRHRAVGIADLMIAAVAERHRVSILHYDADYDLIAEVTEQPTEWVVPRGTVP